MTRRRVLVLVGGTGNPRPDWIFNPDHPFRLLLAEYGIEVAIDPTTHEPFVWSGKLAGIWFWRRRLWEEESESLVRLCVFLFRMGLDIDMLGHSHGGQLMIHAAKKLAALNIRVRTMTTISTPRRKDVPAAEAKANCDYWQHTYDPRRDFIGTLPQRTIGRAMGQVGDGSFSFDRTFEDIEGVVNIPIPANHSDLFGRAILYVRMENLLGPIAYR